MNKALLGAAMCGVAAIVAMLPLIVSVLILLAVCSGILGAAVFIKSPLSKSYIEKLSLIIVTPDPPPLKTDEQYKAIAEAFAKVGARLMPVFCLYMREMCAFIKQLQSIFCGT
jgi:hypothetical protein